MVMTLVQCRLIAQSLLRGFFITLRLLLKIGDSEAWFPLALRIDSSSLPDIPGGSEIALGIMEMMASFIMDKEAFDSY